MANPAEIEPLAGSIQSLSNNILSYAILLAAVGTIAMALLELAKSLFLVRAHYHQLWFRRWIGPKEDHALSEFFVLATGEQSHTRYLFWRAIFDQPSEKLLGQIQAAANIALDYPNIYPNFYRFLTMGSTQPHTDIPGQVPDADLWMNYVKTPPPPGPQGEGSRDQQAREASQARARLSNVIARKLDAFQTNLEYWWARINQTAAIILGTVIFWIAIPQTAWSKSISAMTFITISLLGGLVSPFAKDVVSALSGLKTKRG